ncbi:MAG: M28 family peptidase [Bdellovibrio sp.]|nr:M28 family peptidase [Bdellovibrio sp.]
MYGDPTKPRIVVGAHYDVCDSEIGNPAEGVPGADDNASGVSGMLELARLVQENKIDLSSHSIEFVAYTLEEPPYFRTEQMGSYIHAADLKNKNIEVKFMVSLEMIGYFSDAVNSQKYPFSFPMSQIFGDQANFIAIIGGPLEFLTLNRVQGLFQKESTLPIYKLSAPAFVQGTDWSDHVNYTKFGYSAIMLTDTSFLRNSNYHQSTDTIDTINFEKMADVVLGMRNVLKN